MKEKGFKMTKKEIIIDHINVVLKQKKKYYTFNEFVVDSVMDKDRALIGV